MKTLHRQFVAAIVVILAVSITVGYIIAMVIYHNSIKNKIDQQNIEKAQNIIAQLQQNQQDSNAFDDYLNFVGGLGYQVYVRNDAGDEAYYGAPFAKRELTKRAIERITAGEIYAPEPSFLSTFSMMEHFSNDVVNTVGVPFDWEGKRYGLFLRPNNKLLFTDFHMILVWFVIAIAVISMASVFLLSKYLTKPITKLTEATKEITRENFNFKLNIDRHDEIGELAQSFQVMQRQLQHNDEARKSFVSNVSHDFQSPLMNIRGYAELLKADIKTDAERIEYATIIDRESNRLSKLTKQLLLLTSLDQKDYPMKQSVYEFDKQIKETIRRMQWRLEEHDIEVTYKLTPLQLKADRELLLNMLENLITNAIKYNVVGGSIAIRLERLDQNAVLTIKDTGIGMAPEALEQIFERFYRVDTARDKDGSGLGLSIVKQIVSLHYGRIEVESREKEGTCFTVTLPLASQSELEQ